MNINVIEHHIYPSYVHADCIALENITFKHVHKSIFSELFLMIRLVDDPRAPLEYLYPKS